MIYLILAIGFVLGMLTTTILAHYCPSMFIDPGRYFDKLAKNLEKKADKLEETTKAEIRYLLREVMELVNRINLIK
ncbi:MAG: hypothetical protein DRO12_05545 [Thermoprotei archaeon]|nr:MAG: hypothetical protein DRO12_05545 [Thermoprotei archaeon]